MILRVVEILQILQICKLVKFRIFCKSCKSCKSGIFLNGFSCYFVKFLRIANATLDKVFFDESLRKVTNEKIILLYLITSARQFNFVFCRHLNGVCWNNAINLSTVLAQTWRRLLHLWYCVSYSGCSRGWFCSCHASDRWHEFHRGNNISKYCLLKISLTIYILDVINNYFM